MITALSVIDARIAAEKSLFPLTTLICVWQSKVNNNTKLHEIEDWAKKLFFNYKIIGMFATGHKPVFGDDYIILQVTMTREQFKYYLRAIRGIEIKDADTISDEQLVETYQNNTVFGEPHLKRVIKGDSVAPSGKKDFFMKISKDKLNRSQL